MIEVLGKEPGSKSKTTTGRKRKRKSAEENIGPVCCYDKYGDDLPGYFRKCINCPKEAA